MSVKRQAVADIISSWIGLKENDGSYKPVIDQRGRQGGYPLRH